MKKLSLETLFESNAALATKKPESDNHLQIKRLKCALAVIIKQELTVRQRQILDMYYYQGMNETQIAKKLGIHKSTICRTKQRGLNTIYKFLKYHEFR